MFIQCYWLKFTHFSGCFSFHRLCGSVQGSHNTFSLYSSLDSSRLWQSLLCLSFVTLTVWRRTDRLSCSRSFHQGLCDVFLMLRLGLWICRAEEAHRGALPFWSHRIKEVYCPQCDLSLMVWPWSPGWDHVPQVLCYEGTFPPSPAVLFGKKAVVCTPHFRNGT